MKKQIIVLGFLFSQIASAVSSEKPEHYLQFLFIADKNNEMIYVDHLAAGSAIESYLNICDQQKTLASSFGLGTDKVMACRAKMMIKIHTKTVDLASKLLSVMNGKITHKAAHVSRYGLFNYADTSTRALGPLNEALKTGQFEGLVQKQDIAELLSKETIRETYIKYAELLATVVNMKRYANKN